MAPAIPTGVHSITPYLIVKDSAKAIDFYKRAFGAEEVERTTGPGGKAIMHAEIRIGDSLLMLSDEFPGSNCGSPETLKGTTCQMYVYVPDVDATFAQALGAGAKVVMPVTDMFWGDRYGCVNDPFGHQWGLATHKEDVAREEMQKRADAFRAQMAQRKGAGRGE